MSCMAVAPFFIALGYSLYKLKQPSHHRMCLSSQFHADILWWKKFLVTFNSRSMMLDFRQPVYVQTETSFLGFSAVCSDDWFAGSWSECLQSEARTAATVWNWSGKTLSPGALLAVLYFSFVPYFSACLDFPSHPLSAPGSPRMPHCLLSVK